jgi:hypothetical protein
MFVLAVAVAGAEQAAASAAVSTTAPHGRASLRISMVPFPGVRVR